MSSDNENLTHLFETFYGWKNEMTCGKLKRFIYSK